MVQSRFALLYMLYMCTSSATWYNYVDGWGLFQGKRNFKNAQKCYVISKLHSRFEIQNFEIFNLRSAIRNCMNLQIARKIYTVYGVSRSHNT